MENFVIDYFEAILKKKICYIGRAVDMLSIEFKIASEEENGKETVIALHVQSAWRMVNKKEILFASSDMYEPNSQNSWTENFMWDKKGANLFDERSDRWFKKSDYIVEKYEIDELGDLALHFSNGDKLEVFVDSSDTSECWRIFDLNSEKRHFVMTGVGVEL